MFGLSSTELILIAIIAIIFIKPEDLPTIIRQCGRLYAQIMRMYYAFIDEINSYEDTLKK